MAEVIEIDGSILEGGGQILRNAIAYSALLSKPIRVHSIRHNRTQPGLKAQHLTGIELVSKLCSGTVTNGFISSKEIEFYPQELRAGNFMADAKTAGSVALILQASLPSLLFLDGNSSVILLGGTNVEMAPQIDYIAHILKPILLQTCQCDFNLEVSKRGYYPKGRGVVHVSNARLSGSFLHPVTLMDRGQIESISGRCWVAGRTTDMDCDAMHRNAKQKVRESFPEVPFNVEKVRECEGTFVGSGGGIVMWATTTTGCRLSGTAMMSREQNAAMAGKLAGSELVKFLTSYGCVDEYLQDQLIIFMALSKGFSSVWTGPISLHTKTAIFVAEKLTSAKFNIRGSADGLCVIECQGIGLSFEK